jgi:hypothetical protein
MERRDTSIKVGETPKLQSPPRFRLSFPECMNSELQFRAENEWREELSVGTGVRVLRSKSP